MMQQSIVTRRLAPLFALALAAVILAGCDFPGHRGKTAHQQKAPVSGVTPNAVNKLPENLNEVTIAIKNGKFVQDQIVLQKQGASIIHIDNQDGTAYRFQLLPLVTPTPLGANGATTIDFTTTSAGNFTGQLLPQQGGTVLATINVRIQSAGAVNP